MTNASRPKISRRRILTSIGVGLAGVGAPLMRLPIAPRVQLLGPGYRDRMHLIGLGRELFLPWLVEALHGAG